MTRLVTLEGSTSRFPYTLHPRLSRAAATTFIHFHPGRRSGLFRSIRNLKKVRGDDRRSHFDSVPSRVCTSPSALSQKLRGQYA